MTVKRTSSRTKLQANARAKPEAGTRAGTGSGTEPAEPLRSLTVDVVTEAGNWSVLGFDVETAVQAAADAIAHVAAAGVTGAMVAVVALADNVTVQRLNRQFRKLDKPTNVLSFPSGAPTSAALGDIVLALETVRAEAAELDTMLVHHVQHLAVHGLLHLLGFDHEASADADIMEQLEIEILARLGVADPYAGRDLVRDT